MMSWSSSGVPGTSTNGNKNKFKGVRRRKWGKWVSEIRVPGTQERLWLGTYATPEAAAVAHDVAVYCLRRPSSLDKLNFPDTLSSYCVVHHREDMSPRSVQKVASDVGMDVDARNIAGTSTVVTPEETNSDYEKDKKTDDDHIHRYNTNTNIGPPPAVHSDVFWWEGLGDDCGTCQANQDYRDGEALSISIEDYLN